MVPRVVSITAHQEPAGDSQPNVFPLSMGGRLASDPRRDCDGLMF
jgi:hypothetical protein